ncbi:LarC family nickel insertion protein [Paenibacillus sp. MBLB4367]|uniref:LarC family nickel insertion protein n=1 Tax=Paenibacillus sp. MBLB4367 TaxID=3384767 RepID=UPI0039080D3F
MKIVYLDCFSGISGDMTLAALVDAGADRDYVESELAKIRIEPFALEWKRVNKRGISALKMDVAIEPGAAPTHHRHYTDIVKLIEGAGFNDRVTALSLAIFRKIGIAEAKIHGIPVEKVHFHEVGAIDSIVDIVGVALALDSIGADKIVSAPVPLGSGTVKCDHGIYPVPAPATLEMMKGLPIAPSSHRMELTTPTGAGIASGIVDEFASALPAMIVESVGYGAGTRDLPNHPNVLRVVIGSADTHLTKCSPPLIHLAQDAPQPQEHHHHHHPATGGHSHSHDHDHGHSHSHDHDHGHHGHSHSHDHDHGHHGHSHSHDHDHGDHGHSHSHDHDHGNHGHSHSHDHDHGDHGHSHSHDHDHGDHSHNHSHEPTVRDNTVL